jgi:hypothetical protein
MFSHLDPVNVASFAKALVVLPLPLGDPFDTLWVALVRLPVVGIVLPAMLWISLRDAPARTLALLVSAGISVLPVAWTVPAGRFCYLPGALCCLWGAHALELWCRRLDGGIRARTGPAVVLAFLAVYLSTSLGAQVRVWQQAAILARASVEQFGRVVDRGIEAVHIPNLPHYCAEGPFVMKAYAFGYYYAGHQVPSVRADATVPRCAAAGYPIVDAFPDAYSTHSKPVPGELTLLLQSPVPVAANRPGHPDEVP